ncbi:MAG: LVIVD repeat-containing protein [Gemmatimonadales bacterium]
MVAKYPVRSSRARWSVTLHSLSLVLGLLAVGACAHSTSTAGSASMSTMAPSPDPRVGLKAGKTDAAQALWNLRLLSNTPQPEGFVDGVNSDLAFTGKYTIQGSFNGFQVWDLTDPRHPVLTKGFVCPASQSDVSVYKNLLFVSSESNSGRLDCGTQGVKDTVSAERLRGIRIFDISDIANPKYIGNVQTCRGSHTHSVLVPPGDPENIYIYISGSARVRSPSEMPGCVRATPVEDSASALFRIEVIKVPVAHPEQAAIVSSPRIFNDLVAPPRHGETKADSVANAEQIAKAKASGAFIANWPGEGEFVLPARFTQPVLDSLAKARGDSGHVTSADSAALRAAIPDMIAKMAGPAPAPGAKRPGPTQCHDITLYPTIGLAGGACEGYGMLIDISDPVNPKRIGAVSDSNFSYWHSATFNNSGTKVLFSDEWGGGGQPKCRATDPREWGADALFSLDDRKMVFHGYYKLPAVQTSTENCVAHNGSLIPIPGRDVMVQAWYQGGISVFDWTDASHPKEVAFFDRGPVDSMTMGLGGSWSAYWYNGVIVSSEIGRGLDVLELTPSGLISQNEIDAAKTVRFDYFNVQGQQQFVWPASFALARAWLDQLERSKGLSSSRIESTRLALTSAEKLSAGDRADALNLLASQLEADATKAGDPAKVKTLAATVKELASAKS